jgi:hypothetical protein
LCYCIRAVCGKRWYLGHCVVVGYVLAAILWLAPHLDYISAKNYAKWVARESTKYKVDPLLMIAVVHVETAKSWNKISSSATRDYGLMQIHVSLTTNPHLLGSENILFNPKINFNYGARALAMWKNYHNRQCKDDHPFWAHYAWGYKVKNIKWTIKLSKTYLCLLRKFKNNNIKNINTEIYLSAWLKRHDKTAVACNYVPRDLRKQRTNDCELSQRERKRLSEHQIQTVSARENKISYVQILSQ